jgi:hypothetical protein
MMREFSTTKKYMSLMQYNKNKHPFKIFSKLSSASYPNKNHLSRICNYKTNKLLEVN